MERTNKVIVCSNQWIGFTLYNLYAMNIDRRNYNCYNCEGFRHLARNYRNRGTGGRIRENRRLEYRENEQRAKNNRQNNLNSKRDLIVLN